MSGQSSICANLVINLRDQIYRIRGAVIAQNCGGASVAVGYADTAHNTAAIACMDAAWLLTVRMVWHRAGIGPVKIGTDRTMSAI